MPRLKFLNKNKTSSLPISSGVYAFKNKKGDLLYIGKAANIKERVKNHFQTPSFRDHLFIDKIEKIGYLKTNSEIEALILEAQLIKKYQPKFNILWRDDKNYFFIGITKEDFPRVFITHQTKRNLEGGKLKIQYIGPFVDGKALKQTLKTLRRIFPYRSCKTIPKRPCLWYQLGLCPGPCTLSSKTTQQIPGLKEKIKKESQENVKNLIKILKGQKSGVLKNLEERMEKFSRIQEFEKAAKLRDQIISLKNILSHAKIFYDLPAQTSIGWKNTEEVLRRVLNIKKRIKRIEGYDISNIQGQKATGAMVVFENGTSNKNEYRKFKIKIEGKPNDTAMIKEVIERRLNHKEWQFPEVVLIDGGKAQLNAAKSVIQQFGNLRIRTIALAKRKNELFTEERKNPILLKSLPRDIANLILQIRDEAHRFAVFYHKKLRERIP